MTPWKSSTDNESSTSKGMNMSISTGRSRRVFLGLLSAAMLMVAPGTAEGEVLDTAASTGPGGRLILSAEEIATDGVDVNAVYYLPNRHSGKCLEILDWAQYNGAVGGQWDCHFGNNQLWNFLQHDDGYYSLVNVHSGKCLEILDWSIHNGAVAGQWDCHFGNNQRWWEDFSGGLHYLNKHSGKALEILDWTIFNGGWAGQWDWHGGGNQLWS